jgi:23S rRNA (guanosine2251-2'-O)-methyltransferase
VSLILKNPHSALEVLRERPIDVLEVNISSRNPGNYWNDVLNLAIKHNIPIGQQTSAQKSGRRKNKFEPKSERVGFAETVIKPRMDVSLEQLWADVNEDDVGVWLALDQIQDPHNVGAIFRSAAFFGIRGLILTKDRSAPMNSSVYDVASGGVEHVPFSVQPNLSRALTQAKEKGLWILGTSEHATESVKNVDRGRNWLIILGNEEKGIRQLTEKKCDVVCQIPSDSKVDSLNVSVAAGILMASFTSSV